MIQIKPILQTDPKEILALPPCMDLDRYVLHHIADAPAEAAMALSPTMRFADCLVVVAKLGMMGVEYSVALNEGFFYDAVAAGQMTRKTPVPVWRVRCSTYVGYGRNLEEAICKYAICRIFLLPGCHTGKDLPAQTVPSVPYPYH